MRNTFNFGDMSGYSAGGGLQEGDYIVTNFEVKNHSFQKQDGSSAGPARLGVMITFVPLEGGDEKTQFYSLGGNADKSWAPNPETGKGVVAVPGGPGTPPNASTNWAIFMKELFNAGLPNGILDDDLSVLEGMHVHMKQIPEPEDRKNMPSATGEAAGEPRKVNMIAVVSEIKEDGKPWEGTGGIPAAKPAAKAPGKAATKPSTPPVVKKAPAAPAPAAEPASDVADLAEAAIAEFLGANPKGTQKLTLRLAVFKSISTAHDKETANDVLSAYFSDDAVLSELLATMGYSMTGTAIKAL